MNEPVDRQKVVEMLELIDRGIDDFNDNEIISHREALAITLFKIAEVSIWAYQTTLEVYSPSLAEKARDISIRKMFQTYMECQPLLEKAKQGGL